MFRVMQKIVNEYGQESFSAYGPIRKDYAKAVQAADRTDGYVIDLNNHERVYTSPQALTHEVRQKQARPYSRKAEPQARIDWAFSQLFNACQV